MTHIDKCMQIFRRILQSLLSPPSFFPLRIRTHSTCPYWPFLMVRNQRDNAESSRQQAYSAPQKNYHIMHICENILAWIKEKEGGKEYFKQNAAVESAKHQLH